MEILIEILCEIIGLLIDIVFDGGLEGRVFICLRFIIAILMSIAYVVCMTFMLSWCVDKGDDVFLWSVTGGLGILFFVHILKVWRSIIRRVI